MLINTLNVNQAVVGLLFLLAVGMLLYRRRGGEAFEMRLALAAEQIRASRQAEEAMLTARQEAEERRRANRQPLNKTLQAWLRKLRRRDG